MKKLTKEKKKTRKEDKKKNFKKHKKKKGMKEERKYKKNSPLRVSIGLSFLFLNIARNSMGRYRLEQIIVHRHNIFIIYRRLYIRLI